MAPVTPPSQSPADQPWNWAYGGKKVTKSGSRAKRAKPKNEDDDGTVNAATYSEGNDDDASDDDSITSAERRLAHQLDPNKDLPSEDEDEAEDEGMLATPSSAQAAPAYFSDLIDPSGLERQGGEDGTYGQRKSQRPRKGAAKADRGDDGDWSGGRSRTPRSGGGKKTAGESRVTPSKSKGKGKGKAKA